MQNERLYHTEIEDAYPLSRLQEGMLFHSAYSPETAIYHDIFSFHLRAPFDADALSRAVQDLARRHPILRTSFELGQFSEPLQLVHADVQLPIAIDDLRSLPADEQAAAIAAWIEREKATLFDWTQPPLLRIQLHRRSDETFQFTLSFHHAILDGWSVAVLLTELFQQYLSLQGLPVPALPLPPEASFREFVALEREAIKSEEQQRFWAEKLAGHSVSRIARWPLAETPEGARRVVNYEVPLSDALSQELQRLAQSLAVPVKSVLLAAHLRIVSLLSAEPDVMTGLVVNGRPESSDGDRALGLFLNTLPLRLQIQGGSWRDLVRATYAAEQELMPYRLYPLAELQQQHNGRQLFETAFYFIHFHVYQRLAEFDALEVIDSEVYEETNFTFLANFQRDVNSGRLGLTLTYDDRLLGHAQIEAIGGYYLAALAALVRDPDRCYDDQSLLGRDEQRRLLHEWNATQIDLPIDEQIHRCFEAQAARTPDAIAAIHRDRQLSYAELNGRANRLAHALRAMGVGPDQRVGICVERSLEMLIGLLGILKAGAAYVPLDPNYPAERIQFMLDDARPQVLLTQQHLLDRLVVGDRQVVCLDADWPQIAGYPAADPPLISSADNLAYVLYTSGSTGRPKGVMVSHRNVANFFAGMDRTIGAEPPGVWLALTSISFDISVLELFWTLARGFTVVVQDEEAAQPAGAVDPAIAQRPLDFSLFYFASESGDGQRDPYRLLLDGARFADQHGFAAVWTPERHFHAFGGPYPNPSVTSAAVAAITERIQIRAGSVVLPLHHPLRVAEEWAVVDNLSQGRVGISFASGWHADDFVFAPEQYATRKDAMLDGIQTVQRLWRGETIPQQNGAGHTINVGVLPRPKQAELPVWLTAAGNPETFAIAARNGWNLLTHLLGQSIPELAEKIALYRRTWREAGHPGDGHISLMLHTFVGEDMQQVRQIVREPFKNYLRSSVGLLQNLARSLGQDYNSFSQADLNALLDHAFERYFETSGLFGTIERCQTIVNQLKAIGVDELACLVDFGIDEELVLHSLPLLDRLRQQSNMPQAEAAALPVPEQILRHGVTHLQCTPSRAAMLLLEPNAATALQSLHAILLGGEALPSTLAAQLREITAAELHNMYGPTETTIWSSTQQIASADEITIGRPIANTRMYILDRQMRPVPVGVPGQLFIGGDGVVRGYLQRPDLTAERFIPDPFAQDPGARLYHTGDLARYWPDGQIEFLGRGDQQVKLRGFRIELGEIEAVLRQHAAVRDAVVTVREEAPAGTPGAQRLVAYIVAERSSGANNGPAHAGGHLAEELFDQSALTLKLRELLRAKLPAYMTPTAFVFLDTLPLTPNGKLDRNALPAPDSTRRDLASNYVAPRTPLEEQLTQIWAEVLGVERVGIQDSFVDLGGHSLLSLQLMTRIRETFQVELPLRALFESATVATLAEAIEQARRTAQRKQLSDEQRLRELLDGLSDEQVDALLNDPMMLANAR
jgi:natural product biosynthesis luciferase-like monooxygenase protein